MRAICETAALLARAAVSAGAPEGLISCMQHTTLAGTRELMSHRATGVILATGGTGLVRAAYSSGKPAYGVGPGNVPAFIERTADVPKAVADIFAGKTFDYGTICSSEQAMVVEEALAAQVVEECGRQGAHFLSAVDAAKVSALVFQPGTHVPSTKIVGRAATAIAEIAGISVPLGTRVLIARLEPDQIVRDFPLSAEKLCPILAFYVARNAAHAIEISTKLLEFGGLGHTCVIHSHDDAVIRRFGEAVPAFRVCVNTSAVHGSIGYSTNLFPAMTLGCGAAGGNITSDNIGPQHLMNIKRIAWESRPVEHRSIPARERMAGTTTASARTLPQDSRQIASHAAHESDRALVASTVEQVLAQRGVLRGSGGAQSRNASADASTTRPGPSAHAQPGASSGATAPSPRDIASEIASRFFGPLRSAAPPPSKDNDSSAGSAPPVTPAAPELNTAPALQSVPFVSENDVRQAITRNEKIVIGRKTIVTPSARDLGLEHDTFTEID
jgi:acetaldehyde dehydrogenase (acetylating)